MQNLLLISLITTCRMDYDIFVIKLMQLWGNGGLSRTIANVLYCAKHNIFLFFMFNKITLIFINILLYTLLYRTKS